MHIKISRKDHAKDQNLIKDKETKETDILLTGVPPSPYDKFSFVKLNKGCVSIPRIDDVIDTLQGSKYFPTIDLRSGYWKIEISEKDKKTAVTTCHGLYEFNVMPFGLSLQKIDIDPEQLLYTPKIENIAVIEILFRQRSNRRRIVDIPIRPGDESLELGVAHTSIPAAEESKNVKGKTVNAEFYQEVLWRLHKAVKRKRQDLAQRWRLHHDNAPAHTVFLVTSYLTRIGVEVLPQPPYSPDMSPPDFFLFPKVKRCLKGHRFDDIPNIQRAVTKALTGITPTDYSGAYESWKTRWQRCVDAQGEFFEEY
ncbi:hypothetical protein LAZ67_3003017 [Cordylochernes scorpioides]|uniref:Transposase n=1 Tax=Cordylochernes scorpioides TaxID=51811 RepID=A0ABY6K9M2_9ARAC|nr:hypothetical protein LAZ67_3003017 [Cordylochernes scorpioides]